MILRDAAFRDRMNIELGAYDEACMRHVQSRHSDDKPYPTYWKPAPPLSALESGINIVYVLVHPGRWQANFKENVVNDIRRLY